MDTFYIYNGFCLGYAWQSLRHYISYDPAHGNLIKNYRTLLVSPVFQGSDIRKHSLNVTVQTNYTSDEVLSALVKTEGMTKPGNNQLCWRHPFFTTFSTLKTTKKDSTLKLSSLAERRPQRIIQRYKLGKSRADRRERANTRKNKKWIMLGFFCFIDCSFFRNVWILIIF